MEVIDTAIKIGLGALISGVFAYILSIRRLKSELLQNKLEAKKELVREAVIKYDMCIVHLNQASHDIRLVGLEQVTQEERKKIAGSLVQAKTSMNIAESLARLASLNELADSFREYQNDLNELNRFFTDWEITDVEDVIGIFDRFADRYSTVSPLISRAYDDIYSA